ncbi:MAG: helix-turn-helix transcriptional regulator [Clostridium sp.]|uniref:helix-turn-helix domain-containing protein n=1 Tax=Clostridium sp. TaxID=1506 RepID=UPI0028FF0B70|nr:helix-turn-helix transcriptional regulator [Clostridium sp.]MDU2106566.1 helix-turn-helix transcriptional regulator [Clostridium sp.]MDU3353566.1 helix-turn-helix transcriptional regulator [Clostridium sp.]MDU6876457.1 helix-turn-helix transcriptional regulator [Clostridium sp.]MDU6937443.1 helix-turn-helix transcriptional regulator [Clostridium sp.]
MEISILGKNIKEYRNNRGWSLKKLTEIAEVGYATIYDLENGKKQNINSTTLEKVANALEVSTNELLGIDIVEHTVDDILDTVEAIFESDELKIDDIKLTSKEKEILKSIYINGIDIIRLMRSNS